MYKVELNRNETGNIDIEINNEIETFLNDDAQVIIEQVFKLAVGLIDKFNFVQAIVNFDENYTVTMEMK